MSPVDQSTSRASPTCSHSTEIHRMRAVKQSDSLVCDLSGAKIETNSRHLTNSHLACKNISKMQLISALQHANSAPQDVEWCQQEEIGCFVWFGLEWVEVGCQPLSETPATNCAQRQPHSLVLHQTNKWAAERQLSSSFSCSTTMSTPHELPSSGLGLGLQS